MSKLFQNNPNKLFSKSYRSNQNNINQSVQDIIDLYSQSSSYINNHNNITIDYPRHYSPNYRSPPSLPSISNRKPGHSLERGNISDKKSLFNNANESSILSNIGSNIINNQNQRLKRDKTQIEFYLNIFYSVINVAFVAPQGKPVALPEYTIVSNLSHL